MDLWKAWESFLHADGLQHGFLFRFWSCGRGWNPLSNRGSHCHLRWKLLGDRGAYRQLAGWLGDEGIAVADETDDYSDGDHYYAHDGSGWYDESDEAKGEADEDYD